MNDAAEIARHRLAAAGRDKDRTRRLVTACIAGGLILAVLLLVALLDYWLMLPVAPRWCAALGLVGILAGGVWKLTRLWQRPTALKEAALDVEASRPGIGCEVSTAAEYLSGERKPVHNYEPELVAALQAKAAETVAANRVAYGRRLRVPALLAGGSVVAVAAFLLAVPGAGTALIRALAPWSRASFTHVAVEPGNIEIPVGSELRITNRFSGRPVAHAEFQWRDEGHADWQTAPITGGDKGVFVHSIREIRSSFAYRVAGGDTVSEAYTVTAYIPPAVAQLKVALAPPAYTRLPATVQASPDLSAVRGTDARLQLLPNVPLAKAQLRLTNDTVVPLTATPDGRWEGRVPVTKDADYWIELFDAKGHRGVSARHHVTAIPDNPPKVDITEPGQDMRASATNRIPLKIRGSDDFGVASLKLVFHRLGDPSREVAVTYRSNTNHEFEATSELPLDALQLRDYDVVAYHAEAADNNTLDGPGVGRSPVYFVEITNLEGTGQASKSKPKPGEKVNLLTIEKQIIADTAALDGRATKDKYDELAKRQQDAIAFGRMYQEAMTRQNAPIEAQGEMNEAVTAMERAAVALSKADRTSALPPEENALASLYRVLKKMPELGKLPTQPPLAQKRDDAPASPAVKVVLDAIKKKKPQDPADKELAEMLEEAKELQERQDQLAAQLQGPDRNASKDATDPDAKPDQPNPPNPAGSPQASKSPGKPSPSKSPGSKSGDPGESAQQAGTPPPEGEPKDAAESKPGEDSASKELADAKTGENPGDKPGEKPGEKPGKGPGKGDGKKPGDAKAQQAGKGQGKGEKPADGEGEGDGDNPNDKPGLAGKGGKPGEPKPGQPPTKDGKPADGKPGERPANSPKLPADAGELAKLAPKQEELSKEAKEMAERLERLAGKGSRVGHGAGRQMNEAAKQLDRAAHALKQGNAQSAIGAGDQGSAAMNSAIALLERALAGKPDISDVASEEAPKQYEGAISDYFKRLSRAE